MAPVVDDLRTVGGVLYQTFVTFPYSAATHQRQVDLSKAKTETQARAQAQDAPIIQEKDAARDISLCSSSPAATGEVGEAGEGPVASSDSQKNQHASLPATGKISDEVFSLCTSNESVSSVLGSYPSMAPKDAWHRLYGHRLGSIESSGSVAKQFPTPPKVSADATASDEAPTDPLERAGRCGRWGPNKPSELFLKMYHDALVTLDKHPERGMVSPSLMGSNGVVPLTIISTVPDIVRHMSNLIVQAESEVFLATNYWQNGEASKFITEAIKELSRRVGERGSPKIVMKIIYDRGSVKQLVEPHYLVPEREFTGKAVGLPHLSEIPNIDLQVMNYHNPLLGTFHAKYMIVDRRVAVLQSNNIQDNDNLEMLVHLEGDIVDSLYDMALLSWHKPLEPPLPKIGSPGAVGKGDRFGDDYYRTAPDSSPQAAPGASPRSSLPFGGDDESVSNHAQATADQNHNHHQTESPEVVVSDHSTTTATDGEGQPAPALASIPTTTSATTDIDGAAPDLHQPTTDSPLLPEHTPSSPHYDTSIASETLRVQASVSPSPGITRLEAITRHLNHTTNLDFHPPHPSGGNDENDDSSFMAPYIPHTHRSPVPIAMVSRAPHGPPNHHSVSNPQNATWLSALRCATRSVFIQSPTLNASPLLPAIIAACERGVDVVCYVCLGYNDMGELLPLQGGHNEMVAHNLFSALSPAGREKLHYHWYVAKDACVPIVQSKRQRSCHIKLMIVDECVVVVGNGNQDTQSWFHSQEVNVMIDDAELCGRWLEGLKRNQNTGVYGRLDPETGVWRDEEGKEAEGALGVDPGRFSWGRGLIGAVKRLQGTGGF